MRIFIYSHITLHVSGVHRTHYQEYMKLLLQPLVQIILSGEQARGHVGRSLLPRQYDLYQRLQLQFYVRLMGAMDGRNT